MSNARPRLLELLERCAPGEPLRDGLDRILRSGRGAIVVLGDNEPVLDLCSGGFVIDADFTANRLSELAKMDGAIICDADAERIRRANVHLVPHSQVATTESGIRHRSAERTARQTGAPVIAVSEAMHTVTLYLGEERYTLERVDLILARANQALQTLQRYRVRFDEATTLLTALEVRDLATLRDVGSTLQRAELALRIAGELEWSIVELGRDGRLVAIQIEELLGRVAHERDLVVRDYYVHRSSRKFETVIARLSELSSEEIVDTVHVVRALGHPADTESLETSVTARGHRMLAAIPRIPREVEDNIVRRFGSLPKIMRASLDDLDEVEGVGETRARMIEEGLQRLAASAPLQRSR